MIDDMTEIKSFVFFCAIWSLLNLRRIANCLECQIFVLINFIAYYDSMADKLNHFPATHI